MARVTRTALSSNSPGGQRGRDSLRLAWLEESLGDRNCFQINFAILNTHLPKFQRLFQATRSIWTTPVVNSISSAIRIVTTGLLALKMCTEEWSSRDSGAQTLRCPLRCASLVESFQLKISIGDSTLGMLTLILWKTKKKAYFPSLSFLHSKNVWRLQYVKGRLTGGERLLERGYQWAATSEIPRGY